MSRPVRKDPKVRLNVELSEFTKEQLEKLRDDTQADSLSEVLRKAVNIYYYVLDKREKGATVLIRLKSGTERELEFL